MEEYQFEIKYVEGKLSKNETLENGTMIKVLALGFNTKPDHFKLLVK